MVPDTFSGLRYVSGTQPLKWFLTPFLAEGLEAIGAHARAKILHEATDLFGPAGPSVENDHRHRQLAAFSKRQDKSLDELDSRYYSGDENIEALLAQYALKNKEHFAVAGNRGN